MAYEVLHPIKIDGSRIPSGTIVDSLPENEIEILSKAGIIREISVEKPKVKKLSEAKKPLEEVEKEPPDEDSGEESTEKDALLAKAMELGIKVDKRSGIKKLKRLIEKAEKE